MKRECVVVWRKRFKTM